MRLTKKSRVVDLIRFVTSLLLAVSGHAAVAADDAYPARPIRWIVPYPPGSASDLVARTFGAQLQQRWGQPVIVENRPGAATNIGTEAALKSPADGYTLLLNAAPWVTNPALFERLAYDPARDFIPVSLLVRAAFAILVPAQSAFQTFNDVVSYARANPGQLVYGAPGIGSVGHMAGQQMRSVVGASMTFSPYTGSAQMANDLSGGHLPLAIGNLSVHMPQIRSGQVRALMVLSLKRIAELPDIPSAGESGLPDLVAEGFAGVTVAAGTSRSIVEKLSGELQSIGKLPEVIRQLEQSGTRVIASTPEEFGRFLDAEAVRWGRVIREHKIRIQ